MIPCLEFIARPGSVVVFLIQRRDNFSPWWSAHATTFHTELQKFTPIKKLERTIARQHERLAAEQTVAPARKILQTRGITVSTELYSGSFRKIMESYRSSDAKTMVLQSGKLSRLRQYFAAVKRPLGRWGASPMPLLLRAERSF
jgi:hypothetical protein